MNPASGVLSGIPDSSGTYNFVITSTDSVAPPATERYTVTINPANFAYDPTSRTLTISGTNFQFTQATTADASGTHTSYTFTVDGFCRPCPIPWYRTS